MDTSHIDLKGSIIDTVTIEGSRVKIHFSQARIIKSMTGSKERTLWTQVGDLVLDATTEVTGLPTKATTCLGGDIDENIYTYRDMLPIPFESRGAIRLSFNLAGYPEPMQIAGASVELILYDVPKYIQHIRPGENS